ncbi:HEAT repeat domain-containing protein [Hymenobacter sp. B81]|uniref:HEAT repeat domain-containing protein n=1 Tax=Hymenobacter sp. B81 TaxID=3344878 RepID=UPI0037DDB2DB
MKADSFLNPAAALAAFAAAAEAHAAATECGNSRLGNKAYTRIIAAVRWLKDQGHTTGLLELLDSPSPGVRLWAASCLLRRNTPKAEAVLRHVASENGILGFIAETTLKEWRAGRLTL